MICRNLKRLSLGLLILQSMAVGQFQFSGFADILLITTPENNLASTFQYGQLELDLSASIRPGVKFEGAISFNPETGSFEPGAGFIELVFTGEAGLHKARGKYFDHLGLSIGQFDVPFGVDWQHIASPDRRLVTAPLLNQKSINSWNDSGLNLHAALGKSTLTTFLVNGALDGFALGGRISYHPSRLLEIGASYFSQTNSNELGSSPQVFGADLQTRTGPLASRVEIHYSEDLYEGDFTVIDSIDTHHGFYFQADLDLESIFTIPLVLIGRVDEWSTLNNLEEAKRITVGAAYTATEDFELRLEYLEDYILGISGSQQFILQSLVRF